MHLHFSLMVLSLNTNPITKLNSRSFRSLQQLIKLDLSFCQISSMAEGAFDNMNSLQRLYLEGNRLRTIGDTIKFPVTLHGISLHNNPWHCDCHLKKLREWLVRSNVPRKTEPVCVSPERLEGFKVSIVSGGEFACLPVVSPTSMILTVVDIQNVDPLIRQI